MIITKKGKDVIDKHKSGFPLIDKLTDEQKEQYGLTDETIEKLKWKAFNKIFNIEEYDYRKKPYLVNIQKVIRGHIYSLTKELGKGIIFKNAQYHTVLGNIRLEYNTNKDITDFIEDKDKEKKTPAGENYETLTTAIELWKFIHKTKSLNFSDDYKDLFMPYQLKVFKLNAIKEQQEIDNKIREMFPYIEEEEQNTYNEVIDGIPYLSEGAGIEVNEDDAVISRELYSQQTQTLKKAEDRQRTDLGKKLDKLKSIRGNPSEVDIVKEELQKEENKVVSPKDMLNKLNSLKVKIGEDNEWGYQH